MKVRFTHYLHDDKDAWYDAVNDALPRDMSADEAAQVHQRTEMPFYEVTLECELDTETGEVTVLSTTL